MLTIELSNLRFYAYHGLYKEEKIIGGEYEVNVTVVHHPKSIPVEHLSETIDYTAVYNLVRKKMAVPTPLLETIAMAIASEILSVFPHAEEAGVSIKKINPSLISFEGSVGVKYMLKRG